MSNHPTIAALNARLESERSDEMTAYELCTGQVGYRNGHEAATERLMRIIKKAVEMAESISSMDISGYDVYDAADIMQEDAREFLTTLADASGEEK